MPYSLEESDLELERYCGACNNGISYKTGQHCAKCDGHGYYMTDFGERVLKFITKRLKVDTTVQNGASRATER